MSSYLTMSNYCSMSGCHKRYATILIAWWVPAKVIKYRFSEDKIKKLLQIDYSNIAIEKFREIYPETIKEDFDIDYILEKLKE